MSRGGEPDPPAPWTDDAFMRKVFAEVDANGDGRLDQQEVVNFARKLRPERYITPADAAELVAELDEDGDGQVTYDEFAGWWVAGRGSLTAVESFDLKWKDFGNKFDTLCHGVIDSMAGTGEPERMPVAGPLDLPPPQALARLESAKAAPPQTVEQCGALLGMTGDLPGLRKLFLDEPELGPAFFARTLPCCINWALRLQALTEASPVMLLAQGVAAVCCLPRTTAASLLANMLLCTFPDDGTLHRQHDMPPSRTMRRLYHVSAPQELAKLRMFIHFFERLAAAAAEPAGFLYFRRSVSGAPPLQAAGAPAAAGDGGGGDDSWAGCNLPLAPLEVDQSDGAGIEDAAGCLQTDFANEYLGGGVLCGGCVQEEIRFSASPECTVGLLLCPRMLANEAIIITGAEQFSRYSGYAFSLSYGGDFVDPTPRSADGTIQNCIVAIDALCYPGRPEEQFDVAKMRRELGKAYAGFADHGGEASRLRFETVATGNWGCGAFGGYVDLKALLQWMAATAAGRTIRYFPFGDEVGARLQRLASVVAVESIAAPVTVGWVWEKLLTFPQVLRAEGKRTLPRHHLFNWLEAEVKRRAHVAM